MGTDSTKVISWNIAKRASAWKALAEMAGRGDADLALLQEAGDPPSEIASQFGFQNDALGLDLFDRWPLVSCPINKCGFSAQEKGCGKARSAGNTLPYCQGTQRGYSPSPARPSGVGTIAEGCVAALGNMPDIPCGLRLALGDCAHSESHLFMGQDTRMRRHLVRACRRPSGIPPRGNSVQISVYLFAIALAHKHVRCRTSKTRKPSTTEPCIGSNRRIDLGLDAIHDLNHLSQSGLRPRRANSRRACKRAQPECVAARLPRDLRTSRSSKPLCEKWQWWASVPILWCSADVNTS